MKFEVLKRSHLKRNIIIGIVVVAIISAVVLNFTRAKYRVTESIPIVNGTINYTLPDLNITALYIDGVAADSLESNTNYTLDTERSNCTYKDGSTISNLTLNYDSETQTFTIIPYTTKGTKCNLYFNEVKILLKDAILSEKDIQTREDFSTVLSTNTNGIIYQETTSDGTTYYFAGDTDENWVSFAGFYWRIIRINEDGSIRMIYSGDSESGPAETGVDTQISTASFSSTGDNRYDNAYVGYMYTLNNVHGTGTESGIKKVVDEWYEANILDTEYEDLLSTEAGFCGDRTSNIISNEAPNDTGGSGTTTTYYGARYRLFINRTPTFECNDEENDLYTVDASSKGNHALTYPVGLISADEVTYAGSVWSNNTYNSEFYLYTNQVYWTLSPDRYQGDTSLTSYGASNFTVSMDGRIYTAWVNNTYGVRPVINLSSNVTIISGDSTSSNPYIIAT